MVEFHRESATRWRDDHGHIKATVGDSQVIQNPQGSASKVAEFGVVSLGLEFGDDCDRKNDVVLSEAEQRLRVTEQHACIKDVGAGGGVRFRLSACHAVFRFLTGNCLSH